MLSSVLPVAMVWGDPLSAVSHFVYTFLFGMAACAHGLWKRLLLWAPAVAAMILSWIIEPPLAEVSSNSPWPYLLGGAFGFLLMVSAFYPRRQKV